jgi:hypothetical protein
LGSVFHGQALERGQCWQQRLLTALGHFALDRRPAAAAEQLDVHEEVVAAKEP